MQSRSPGVALENSGEGMEEMKLDSRSKKKKRVQEENDEEDSERLARNRESARESRRRKKAYIQTLENEVRTKG